jgi:hypothetical protein
MMFTIREAHWYLEDHPDVAAAYAADPNKPSRRQYVNTHYRLHGRREGRKVRTEPYPQRLVSIAREAWIVDDSRIPGLPPQSQPHKTAADQPAPTPKPPRTTPPSQQAARILAANPYIHVAWGRLTQDEQRTWGSLIEFALANPDIKP